ncbi:MAG TPA: glycosyltransferase [Anaerolineaceae bacterium]|nr:glycosyltransferase [Anaerolineaceae bacterium]
MNLPKISIVIPSFNQGHFLEQALQSVLTQNYPNLEVIVIDGGSTDGSQKIIEKYSDQLAYWESIPDRGQSHAINKGFAHTTGEIITFLSSDDYYLPGAFQDVADNFRKHPETGAIIGGFCFQVSGNPSLSPMIPPFLHGGSPTDLSLGPPGKYRLHQVATFYSRKALEKVGFYVREDLHYVMDRELLYRVCRQFSISLSPKAYGVFRKHSASKTSSNILPFAKEFSNLYLLSCTGEPRLDRKRKRMARYRQSRGFYKYAQVAKPASALFALLRAAVKYPRIFFQRGYWVKIFKTIHSIFK